MTTTCTVTTTATGGKCGKPAVHTFGAYGECAEHVTVIDTHASAYVVGDAVTVTAYGKTYPATVTRITKTGAAYARFTTAKGTTKTVRV